MLAATLVFEELVDGGAPVLDRDILVLLVEISGELLSADRANQWLGLPGSAAGELITAVERLGSAATRVAKEDDGPVEEGTAGIDLYVSKFGPSQFLEVSLTSQFLEVSLTKQGPGENVSSIIINQEIGEKEVLSPYM